MSGEESTGEGFFEDPTTIADDPPDFAGPRSDAELRALVESELALVDTIARVVAKEVGYRTDRDELRGVGRVALFEAACSYDPARSTFSGYARRRLRWAMLDFVRASSDRVAGRPARMLRAAEAVRAELTAAPVDSARTEAEHATNLRQALLAEATAMAVAFASSASPKEDAALHVTPEDELVRHTLSRDLSAAMAQLPEAQRTVVERYYFADERFDDIARSLGLSKSWVSRLHAQAMAALAKLLAPHR
jgi:RNA polymerase sigma factor FliA